MDALEMRKLIVLAALLAGCIGPEVEPAEARHVGVLLMRDRRIELTPAALDAVGNESLRQMTAIWADVDRDLLEIPETEF
jgi:hypothetical protein